jgi:twitching motility protein PilT
LSDPIYEIPILPAGTSVGGWTPGIKPRADAAPSAPEISSAAYDAAASPVHDEPRFGGIEAFDQPAYPGAEVFEDNVPVASRAEGRRLRRSQAPALEPYPEQFEAAPSSETASTSSFTEQFSVSAPYDAAPTSAASEQFAAQPAYDVTPTVSYSQPAASAFEAPSNGHVPPAAYVPPNVYAPQAVAPTSAEPRSASSQQPWLQEGLEPANAVLRDVTLRDALHEVVRLNASDLHVTADAPPMIRVNGGLRAIAGAAPWSRDKIVAELSALLNKTQATTFETELELDFAHTLSEESRFRVNYYQQRGAIGAAFRLIPTEIKRLSDLGVPDTVSRFATLPRGLVLVTGPTGSGKSTTLAGLIDLVNRTRADHIVTVEDPIEFMHKNQKSIVNQREVGSDTHSFANALKHVLRQDPDVILIGELRDLETISVALTAAETGHLVFATLHTQDAAQTIDRIIDVFPSHQQDQVRTQLAGTLQGVVSQTLVPKASGTGRVVATEVMVITPALANLIREGKTYQILSAMQAGKELGMHTMDQHLAELVNSGRITAQAAKAKAHDPDGFARMLHGVRSPTEEAARAMQASEIDFGDSFSSKLER